MDAQTILRAAQEIKQDIIAHRRQLHRHPEAGRHLPKTTIYVKEHLKKLGYEPTDICDSGIAATITGKDTGRCILLRADMDALPISEETELDFKSQNDAMHACGHDMHTAILLGTAALLQAHKSELNGTVKLVFQPDEEGFTGAKSMLEAGVLENPKPQAGFALHVHSGTPTGTVICGKGTFMAGCTLFRITVTGISCHGAMPETGIDPINIAAHIYTALQTIISREISPKESVAVTIGKFYGGHGPNIIPQDVFLEGTIRTFDPALSAHILERIRAIAQGVAQSLRGTATAEELASTPPLVNHPDLVTVMANYAQQLLGEKAVVTMVGGGMGSEDFAAYTQQIPCSYLLLGAGSKEENPLFGLPMHNEKVVFNEEILPRGAALETWCAIQWLKNQAT